MQSNRKCSTSNEDCHQSGDVNNIQDLLRKDKVQPVTLINLQGKQIKDIPKRLFEGLNSLKLIDLSINQIQNLDKNAFRDLNALSEINFARNQITTLHGSTFSCCNIGTLTKISFSNNQIKIIEENLFNNSYSLEYIDFSGNQIEILSKNLFNGLSSLEFIDFSSNQIESLDGSLFNETKSLKEIYFSRNHIQDLPETIFKGLGSLEKIYFTDNQIKSLHANLFNDLSSLKNIHFSGNQIKVLDDNLFQSCALLEYIELSCNQIESINESLFNNLGLLEFIHFASNQIQCLNERLFDGLNSLMLIDFSGNQIKYLDENLFDSTPSLGYIDFSSNQIQLLSEDLFKSKTSKELYVDFSDNIDFNGVSSVFSFLFENVSKSDISYDIYLNSSFFHTSPKNRRSFHSLQKSNHLIKNRFLSRKTGNKFLRQHLLSIYLNTKCIESNLIVAAEQPPQSESFESRRRKVMSFEWSLLDYLFSIENTSAELITSLRKHVEAALTHNPLLINLEFKFRSAQSLEAICACNSKFMFEEFFPTKSLLVFIEKKQHVDFKYVENEAHFFVNIDFCKCFDAVMRHMNEEIGIHLLLILKYVYAAYPGEANVKVFNQTFNQFYLGFIFENKWWEMVKFLLDSSVNAEFLSFYQSTDRNPTNKVFPVAEVAPPSLLELIKKSSKLEFLNHRTTGRLVHRKWQSTPRFVYYFQVFIFTILLLFYSIHIELYKSRNMTVDYERLNTGSKYISLVLNIYFLLIEYLQILTNVASGVNGILYFMSYTNLLELVTFPLSIVTLLLGNSELKSAFYSLSILFAYNIFVLRLDKFMGIGPFVNVFGNIIKNSFKVFIVVAIINMGFLLSFRNRSNFTYVDAQNNTIGSPNQMSMFNTTFEFAIFKLLTFATTQVTTDGMGIDQLTPDTIVNYAIYGCFIFVIPILAMNIFTGISIDEIQKLLIYSKAEHMRTKITYVFKLEARLKKLRLDLLLRPIGNVSELVEQCVWNAHVSQLYQMYKNKDKVLIDEKTNQHELIEQKLSGLLCQLSQLSLMCRNKFDYLDKKQNNLINKLNQLEKKLN